MDTNSPPESAASDPSSMRPIPPDTPNFYNFETTLAPWVPSADAGLGRRFLAREPASCDRLLTGTNYADLKGGSPIPGTGDSYAFIETGFPASSDDRIINVSVKFDAQSIDGCEGCKVAVYISNSPVSSFVAQANGVDTLTSSWGRYGHSESVTVNDNNAIYIALGWVGTPAPGSAPNVGFDCINIDIAP